MIFFLVFDKIAEKNVKKFQEIVVSKPLSIRYLRQWSKIATHHSHSNDLENHCGKYKHLGLYTFPVDTSDCKWLLQKK